MYVNVAELFQKVYDSVLQDALWGASSGCTCFGCLCCQKQIVSMLCSRWACELGLIFRAFELRKHAGKRAMGKLNKRYGSNLLLFSIEFGAIRCRPLRKAGSRNRLRNNGRGQNSDRQSGLYRLHNVVCTCKIIIIYLTDAV